ncbi:hypothetical protein EEB14_11170 [Rhodococcus sp. WS4]|nr:hypothetical protein EEB14_11170 [Rhodococcus sp. WS4]
MSRDRTARNRIWRYLGERGPVTDADGLATKRLNVAVSYQGSPVAFIQLIAVMEREGELERDVRGKRTYRIALASGRLVAGDPSAPTAAERGTAGAVVRDTSVGLLAVDYALLARSLLLELTGAIEPGALDKMRAANRRITQERDDYARRLELARAARGAACVDRGERAQRHAGAVGTVGPCGGGARGDEQCSEPGHRHRSCHHRQGHGEDGSAGAPTGGLTGRGIGDTLL